MIYIIDTKNQRVVLKLEGSTLEGANLRWRDLQDADLTRRNLKGADLRDTDLRNADLGGADLRGADLTGATGLTAASLAGANLHRALLPPEIAAFEDLKQAEEMSKNCGKYFVGLMLGSAFTLLTMASTSDVGFFNEASSATLPIIGSSVSTVLFYFTAPVVLLATYIYLHMELQRLWDRLAALPAVFPDGALLDKKAYPWMLNGLANCFTDKDWRRDAPLMWLQRFLADTLAWRFVPIVLSLLWLRYLRRHDWFGTNYHIILVSVSILVGYLFYSLMARTFRREHGGPFTIVNLGWRKVVRRAVTMVLVPTVLFFYSYGAIKAIPEYQIQNGRFVLPPDNAEGIIMGAEPPENAAKWATAVMASAARRVIAGKSSRDLEESELEGDRLTQIRSLRDYCRLSVPSVLNLFRYSPFADLSGADISTRPSGWTGQKPEDFALIKGARMRQVDLHYARAYSAFLVKADLTGANLDGAILANADLRKASLTDTRLHAILTNARLDGANLTNAHLEGADLTGAFLTDAAGLSSAHLDHAILRKVHLNGANLTNAHLEDADLTDAFLTDATGLSSAHLDHAILRKAHLVGALFENSDFKARGAALERANFEGADLRNAHLSRADLRDAHFDGAHLGRAHLIEADLRGAHLREADLSGAHLIEANLIEADLRDADLRGADLGGADLIGAELGQANLSQAHLRETDFHGAHLNGADLREAHLEGAWFVGADLSGAYLGRAHLSGADLSGAHLYYANLTGADLRRVDLTGAKGLTQGQLNSAITDKRTTVTWPLSVMVKPH